MHKFLLAFAFSLIPVFAADIDDIPVGGSLLLEGSPANGHINAQSAGFKNAGILTFESREGGWSSTLTLTSGALTNLATGVININPGTGGDRYINGDILNFGAFNVLTGLGFPGGHTFEQNGGALNLQAGINFDGITFRYGGGTIIGTPYLVNSILSLNPGAPAPVNFTMTGGNSVIGSDIGTAQTVLLQGNSRGGFSTLHSANGFKNSGTINLESADGGYSSNLQIDSGALTNVGTINLNPGAGGERTIAGDFINLGFLNAKFNGAFSRANGKYINAGTFTLSPDFTFRIDGKDQEFIQRSGTLAANGFFFLSTARFTFEGGVITGTPYLLQAGLTIVPGSGPASFMQSGADSVLNGDVQAGQIITLRGDGTGGHSQLSAPKGFLNNGTLRFLTADGGYNANFNVAGTLTNGVLGVFESNVGAGGPRNYTGNLLNLGTFTVNQPVNFATPDGLYDNRGTFRIAENQSINIGGQNQTFTQSSGKLEILGGFSANDIRFNYSGGTITGNPYLINSLLAFTPNAQGSASFITTGGGARLAGNIGPSQEVWIRGDGRGGHTQLTSSNGFSNAGILRLETVDGGYTANLGLENGTLTNLASGVINVSRGAAGPRNLLGNLLNLGTINLTENVTFSRVDGSYVNRGNINVAPDITLRIGGQNQSFIQEAGTIDLKGGFVGDNINFGFNGGTITSPVYLVQSKLNIGAAATQPSQFTLSGPDAQIAGDIKQGQVVWLQGNGNGGHSRLTAAKGFRNSGTLQIESRDGGYTCDFAVTSGVLTNATEGTFLIGGGAGGPRSIYASVLNQGLVQVKMPVSFPTAEAAFVNEGQFLMDAGMTVTFAGPYTQVSGLTRLNESTFNASSSLQIRGGTLAGSGAINGAVTNAGALSLGTPTTAGTLTVNGPYISSSSSVFEADLFSGSADFVNVIGRAAVGGRLVVRLASGFVPADDASFTLLQAQSVTGNFSSFDLPKLAQGKSWEVTYENSRVVLRVKASVAANAQIKGSVKDDTGKAVANASLFAFVGTLHGLRGDYFNAIDLTNLTYSRLDATVDFNWGGGVPAPQIGAEAFSVRWTGKVTAKFSEAYTFYTSADNGVRLFVDNNPVTDRWVDQGPYPAESSGTVNLTAGQQYDLRLEFFENFGGAEVYLSWSSASQPKQIIPASQLTPSSTTNLDIVGGSAVVLQTTTDSNGNYSFPVPNESWTVGLNNLPTLGYDEVPNQTAKVQGTDVTLNFTVQKFSSGFLTISGEVDPAGSGSITGAGSYPSGSSVTVNATPNTTQLPWQFVNWTEGGLLQSTNASYTFNANRDRQLVAHFVLPTFQLTTLNNPPAGGTVAGAGRFSFGAANTLTASANTGYRFRNWTRGSTVLSTSPTLTLVVKTDDSVTANYDEANLTHVVSTGTAPSGLANVAGGGTFNNGQSTTISTPPTITRAPNIYTFKQFTLNGSFYTNKPSFTKALSTLDATNLFFQAEYDAQSITPVVVRVTANSAEPVPSTTNLVLTIQFDRPMQETLNPLVAITNATSPKLPIVPLTGTWLTTVFAKDTYRTPAITLTTGMDGTNTVVISGARDLNGNALSSTNALVLVIDATKPDLSNIAATPALLTADVSWTSSEIATATVEFGPTTSYGTSTVLEGSYALQRTVTLADLIPNTTYHYRVHSTDVAGNESISGDLTFTTLPDKVAPDTVILTGPQNGEEGCAPVVFTWTGSDDASSPSKLTYAVRINGGVLSAFAPTNSFTFPALIAGSYTFEVIARDQAGNADPTPARAQFSFNPGLPIVSGIAADPAQADAVITWSTDKPSSSQVEFGVTATFGTLAPVDARLVSNHSYRIGSLAPNTTYNYRVRSIDACGRETVSPARTFITKPAPDLQVVNASVLPASLASGVQMTVRWTNFNSGAAPTTGPWFDLVTVTNTTTGKKIGEAFVNFDAKVEGNLAASARSGRSVTIPLPDGSAGAGNLSLTILADAFNNQLEQNASATGESNNSATLALTSTLSPYPDLIATNIVITPSNIQAGGTYQISWDVRNTGNGPARGAFSESVKLLNISTATSITNAMLQVQTAADSLVAGQSIKRQITIRLPDGSAGAGELSLLIMEDAGDSIFEYAADGSENSSTIQKITSALPPYPDLVVNGITAPPSAPAGQPITISWNLLNQGQASASGPWVEQIYLASDASGSGAQLLTVATFEGTVPSGQTIVRSASVTLPAFATGDKWFVIRTDAGNDVFELNKANNVAVDDRPVNVQATLTLTLSTSSVAESAANPAASATVTRNTDPQSNLEVTLLSSAASRVTVPSKVLIPAGQASVTFPVAVVANQAVDTADPITITASAGGFASGTAKITVADDDTAALAVSFTAPTVRENAAAGTVSGIVTRNTSTASALVVSLNSSDSIRIVVPATVTIPAGQASAAFDVRAADNTDPSKPVLVTVTASAQGFVSLPDRVEVLDDDTPSLTLTLSDSIVSEGAANPASLGTLTRAPVTPQALDVVLDSSLAVAARVPLTVTIPAGQASVTFPINVVDDEELNGSREIRLSAYVADSMFGTPLTDGSGVALLTVTDNEGPALRIAFATDVISETGSTTATVTRNTPATNNLVITLISGNTAEATVPATVTIPLGQSSANFTVQGKTDNVQDGIKRLDITASATGYAAAVGAISVSDINLADLRIAKGSLPARGNTEGFVNATWTVSNDGSGTGVGPWVDRIYLVTSTVGENPQLVGEFLRAGTLNVGQTYDRIANIVLPQKPGEYYLMVVADADNAVNEGSERNNSTIVTTPILVEPAYRASVQTAVTTAISGTPIPLTGRAFKNSNGDAMPFALVKVRVLIKGTRRTIDVRTDASGNFQTVFQPLPGEAGHVTIGADHPGLEEDPVQDEFSLFAIHFRDSDLTYRLFPTTTVSGQAELENLGDLDIHALSATIEGLPAFLTADLQLTNKIAGGSSGLLRYTFAAGQVPSAVRVQATIKVSSQEGAIASLPITITITPQTPNLIANPGFLASGMTRGTQKFVEFELSNVGGAASGPLELRLPPVPWLSVTSPTNLPSLAPGENTKVVLKLNPAADLPLERYDGSLIVSAPATSVTVPFQFRAISEARGDLQLTVDDDYTYYVAGSPKVPGALATLTDPLTGNLIASGTTDVSGAVNFTNVFEGAYQLQVTADKHSTFRSPIEIVPGILIKTNVFLDRQAVTYHWSVVPTEIEDHYRVILEPVFETEVPTPVVTIDNPMIIPLIVRGEDTQFEVKVTNHGLIAAERVSVAVPQHPDFDIIPLVEVIDVLPAKTTLSIPVVIRAKASAQFASEATIAARRLARQGSRTSFTGCTESPRLQVKWSFVCGPDRRWRLNDADIIPVCVEQSCWEKIKDAAGGASFSKGDFASKGAGAAALGKAFGGAIADCVDPCLGTIVSMAIGVGTRDVKGAVTAALGFGSCFCPSIPSLGSGAVQGGPIGGVGGSTTTYLGGSGPGGSPSFPWVAPRIWEISGCRPGQTASGDKTFSTLAAAASAPTTTPGNVCARVRLRIEQEAVITRAAFLGTLEIDNDHADVGLSQIRVTIDIRDEHDNSVNELFGIRGPEVKGMTAIDGTGTLGPSSSGSAKYTFIPTRDAAKEGPTIYRIGGTLRYLEGTNLVEVPLLPSTITAYPDPVLNLVYFQQRDVYGDDPNTDEVEASEPFDLGLLVKNTGKGAAVNFKISSAQPKIIDNEKGLLIDFKIVGTRVGSDPATPSLSANVGRIEPGQSKVVTWLMTSSLQGKFIEYNARFEHEDALGDKRLSLIDSVEVHELIHTVRADRPTDDTLPDFLVNDVADADSLPDTLYLSDGSVAPVNLARNGAANQPVGPGQLQVQVTAALSSGWNYLRMADPGPGYRLFKVVRSDGKELRIGENVWTTDRSFPSSQTGVRRENLLHLLDFNGTGAYTLSYHINDSSAPSLDQILPITPFVQANAVGSVDLVFSEGIDPVSFNPSAVQLSRNGANVALTGLSLNPVDATIVRLNGLSAFTSQDGTYELRVAGSGFQDFGGNSAVSSASVRWAKGISAPVLVDLQAADPVVRNIPVNILKVTFSKPLSLASATSAAVTLTRDGGPNLIFNGVALVSLDGTSFNITGLGPITATEGKYTLTVNAAAVQDTEGHAGSGSLSTSWQMDATGPSITTLESIATNPRNIVVPALDVTFSEPIDARSFDFSDITLTRNGGPNLITSEVTVTPLSDTKYRISNFSWVSGAEGTYSLTVNSAGLKDLAGNAGRASASQTWVMDTTAPLPPAAFTMIPDPGSSSTDGITSTQRVVLSGSLAETNLTVRITDLANNTDAGLVSVTSKTFSRALSFTAAGAHRLRAVAVDAAGNISPESFFEVFVDLVGPTAQFKPVIPDPRTTAVPSVDVIFSEAINDKTLGLDDLRLTRDSGPPIPLNGVSILFASSNTFRISALAGLTDNPGFYQLTLNTTNVQDVAGNAGVDQSALTWRRIGPNTAPILSAISDKLIGADSLLLVTNKATDLDIPSNTLTFSLAPGAPVGSTINATNGLFSWRPTRAQAARTYNVTVVVTDNGTPALSASQTFHVTVTDYLELNIGSIIVPMGEQAVVPITAFSSAAITNLSLVLNMPPDHITNLVLEGSVAQIASANLQPISPGKFSLQLGTLPGTFFQGSAQIAQLTFLSLTNRLSAFVPLQPTQVAAAKQDSAAVETIIPSAGRVIVIGREPLLEAGITSATRGQVVLYGNPGVSYQLQTTSRLNNWTNDQRIGLTNYFQVLENLVITNRTLFYRSAQVP